MCAAGQYAERENIHFPLVLVLLFGLFNWNRRTISDNKSFIVKLSSISSEATPWKMRRGLFQTTRPRF